jgi:carbonic anhydrase
MTPDLLKIDDAGCCACCGGVTHRTGLSRRVVLRSGFAAAALTATAASFGLTQTVAAKTPGPHSPEAALQALLEGNKRFVDKQLNSFDADLEMLKRNTAEKQEPFAAVLSCADSRVPVELVFDQTIGKLFVTRVAGNLASPEVIASLEYGAAVLGTKAILVLGHANCGAVKAAIEGKEVPGQISELYAALRPAVDAADGDLVAAIKANARIQAHILSKASPVLAGLIKDGDLKIASGYYALDTGEVMVLD